jgi:hypothetical protein
VSKKYFKTLAILENYVGYIVDHIKKTGYKAKKINSSAMGVKEIIFLQDESRARVFDQYSKQLEKKIRENSNLGFLNNFIAEPDKFKHSGLTCRKT